MSDVPERAPRGAAVFCRVIDNFGDAGVSWRLMRRFRALGVPGTLVIDHPETLAKLAPGVRPDEPCCEADGIRVVRWDAMERAAAAGDLSLVGGAWPSIVMETFGCRLPEAVETGLCDGLARLYLNLDYLSAEDWVEGSHGIWGLHPSLPLKKLWFFPGFTEKTGGLIIEDGLNERRLAFDRKAALRRLGADPASLTLYFFAYPTSAVDRLAQGLRALARTVNLVLAPGAASEKLRGLIADAPNVKAIAAPFVPQERFDEMLWCADAAIVRGEDSFVRAQLAALPILWSVYPTEDKAHEVKLAAWLGRVKDAYLPGESAARGAFAAAAESWVKGTMTPQAFAAWIEMLPVQRRAAERWRQRLFAHGDLARRIVALSETQARSAVRRNAR
ncbi:MAG: Protein-arginine rhamnosyltransferase [Burkholderia sp.]|jgi:uncharacterized repeat protein (TIGR03837 family)